MENQENQANLPRVGREHVLLNDHKSTWDPVDFVPVRFPQKNHVPGFFRLTYLIIPMYLVCRNRTKLLDVGLTKESYIARIQYCPESNIVQALARTRS